MIFAPFTIEERVPDDHPLPDIKRLCDRVPAALSRYFAKADGTIGRVGIPSESLLNALLLRTGGVVSPDEVGSPWASLREDHATRSQKAPAPFGAEVSICTSDKPGSVHAGLLRRCDHFSRRAVADAIRSDLPAAFRPGRASGLSTGGGCMVLHAAW